MKKLFSLLALPVLTAVLTFSQAGCAGVYVAGPGPAYYRPAPVSTWGGTGFYGGAAFVGGPVWNSGSTTWNRRGSWSSGSAHGWRGGSASWGGGSGSVHGWRGGSASWGGGSGSWHGPRGGGGSWHR